MAIDAEMNHEIVVEDLDEETVLVKENMLATLKQKLEEVRQTEAPRRLELCSPLFFPQRLADTMQNDEDDSD
jgi:hypothetical protein